METEQVSKVAELNDSFRRRGLGVTITVGVQELYDLAGLLQAVREFDEFTDGNDPYGEHDFGGLDWGRVRVIWKIDYYNQSLDGWCDPLSRGCQRVLTIMLVSEY